MDLSLLKHLPLVSFGPGEVVITEGQAISGLYFLESGEAEVLKGGEVIAEVYEPGAVFGDMAYLLGGAPTATVRTLTSATFRHVAEPGEFFARNPAVSLHMATILARRLDSLNRYMVDIKHQFRDRSDHLGIIDEVLDALMHKHPRDIPRRESDD